MKPELVEVLDILKMKARAAELYAEIDKKVSGLLSQYGEGRYDYNIADYVKQASIPGEFAESLVEAGDYLKFELVDNIAALSDGRPVWKSVGFNPVSFSSGSLKRCPDSLKIK